MGIVVYYNVGEFTEGSFVVPRFFADRSCFSDGFVLIEGDDVKHISKVLRLREGDSITVCDKCGTDSECVIEDISAIQVRARVVSEVRNLAEPNIKLTVYQGLPKGDKMDYIVQKCVELGAVRIVPVITKRVVSLPKDCTKKCERWQRIAYEAAKQCGRGIIPKVAAAVGFDDALRLMSNDALNIMPYENELENTLKQALHGTDKKEINIIIGPEGGFDEDEVGKAKKNGLVTVTLGARILRTETASPAVCAAIMYETDN